MGRVVHGVAVASGVPVATAVEEFTVANLTEHPLGGQASMWTSLVSASAAVKSRRRRPSAVRAARSFLVVRAQGVMVSTADLRCLVTRQEPRRWPSTRIVPGKTPFL